MKRKVIISGIPSQQTATAAAKKPAKKVKQATNTQIGVINGLLKDATIVFHELEETVEGMAGNFDDFEGRVEDNTFTAASTKSMTTAMRDAIKNMKLALAEVKKAEKSLHKAHEEVIKGIHPESQEQESDEEETEEE